MKPSIAVTLCLALCAGAIAQERPAAPPPDPAREARLSWFREAKYGLFIHWGLYAIPAGEWKGKAVPGIGEWIMNRARIPVREYEALAAQWNPVKFDAEAWVRLAEDAGVAGHVVEDVHHDPHGQGSRSSAARIASAAPAGRSSSIATRWAASRGATARNHRDGP